MLLADEFAVALREWAMERVLKRIALHGLLTALFLAALGVMFTQLASTWLASSAPPRAAPVEGAAPPTADPVNRAIRYRVPLTMAGWGFAFVAVSELLVYAVRGPKKPVVAPPPPDDTAEKLLEELLKQADAAMAKEKDEAEKKKAAEDASHTSSILTPPEP